MSDQRDGGIAWTDVTWNPVRGCSRVSEGCRNCYAERMAARFCGPGQPYEGLAHRVGCVPRWTGKVVLVPERLSDPLHWRKPRRVFVNSMSDLFHEALGDAEIGRVFDVMGSCPQHTFQVLTKRAGRMRDFMRAYSAPDRPLSVTLPNVWLGVSVEDQATADARIPLLLQTPAAVRWVSYEPALGPVDLTRIPEPGRGTYANALVDWHKPFMRRAVVEGAKLDWIVVGGESGPGARAFDLAWARSTVAQCKAAEVACFVKQLGSQPTWSGNPDWPNRKPGEESRARERCRKAGGVGSPFPNDEWRLFCARGRLHSKGGYPSEWPEDLRVRQFPA